MRYALFLIFALLPSCASTDRPEYLPYRYPESDFMLRSAQRAQWVLTMQRLQNRQP